MHKHYLCYHNGVCYLQVNKEGVAELLNEERATSYSLCTLAGGSTVYFTPLAAKPMDLSPVTLGTKQTETALFAYRTAMLLNCIKDLTEKKNITKNDVLATLGHVSQIVMSKRKVESDESI